MFFSRTNVPFSLELVCGKKCTKQTANKKTKDVSDLIRQKVKDPPLWSDQGCQIVYFQTKNPNLGKFWSVLQWKMLVNFTAFWSLLRPFGIFYAHLVCIFCGHFGTFSCFGVFFPFWYFVPRKIWQLCQRHANPFRKTSNRTRFPNKKNDPSAQAQISVYGYFSQWAQTINCIKIFLAFWQIYIQK
jgi:hypothetical protein